MYDNKLLPSGMSSIERQLILAARRAAAGRDDAALISVVNQVGQLADTARATRDRPLQKIVERLVAELRPLAVGGPKSQTRILEHKSGALSRSFGSQLELKRSTTDGAELSGLASVFNNVDYGGDIVLPGAFKKSLRNHERLGTTPGLFWMHDPARVAGKWLSMRETDIGLVTQGILAPTELGQELSTLIAMGALDGLSIGFYVIDQDYNSDGHRLIKQAELIEVSVVSLPMNPKARLGAVQSRSKPMPAIEDASDDDVEEATACFFLRQIATELRTHR
jgi:uncharacterized protein